LPGTRTEFAAPGDSRWRSVAVLPDLQGIPRVIKAVKA